MELSNNYLATALDAYPYDLEEAINSLNLAYSYEPENTTVLLLLGRYHAEILKDYEGAKQYYADALAADINAVEIYPYYIISMLKNEDLMEAEKLIKFALTIKGNEKAWIYCLKSWMHEMKLEYKKAIKSLDNALVHVYNTSYARILNDEKERIKKKMGKKSKKQKKKSKK